MKRILLVFSLSTVSLLYSAFAQIAPNAVFLIGPSAQYSHNQNGLNLLTGDWANNNSQPLNYTQGSADLVLVRGIRPDVFTATITNNVSGRIVQRRQNNAAAGNAAGEQQTTIIMNDETTITGKAAERPAAQRDPSEAIFAGNFNSDAANNLGQYHLREGIYIAGDSSSSSITPNTGGGRGGWTGGFFQRLRRLTIDGSSFIGGSISPSTVVMDGLSSFGGNGLWAAQVREGVRIFRSEEENQNFEFIGGHGGSIIRTARSPRDSVINSSGGEGAYISNADIVFVTDGLFQGGGNADENNPRSIVFQGINAVDNRIYAEGGNGIHVFAESGISEQIETVALYRGTYQGGSAGLITADGPNSSAYAFGGVGAYIGSTRTESINGFISGGRFYGGKAGSVTLFGINEVETLDGLISSNGNSRAYAHGGHGIFLNLFNAAGTFMIGSSGQVTTVENTFDIAAEEVFAMGTSGGRASVRGGSNILAYASGGSGIYVQNADVFIEQGHFQGGDGGTARVDDDSLANTAVADGGSGVYVQDSSLTISGGTFIGGAAGRAFGPITSARDGAAVWAVNSDLTVTTNHDNNAAAKIEGDVFFENDTDKNLHLTGGEITGDIVKWGTGTAAVKIDTNTVYSGSFIQEDGSVVIDFGSSEEGRFFSDVRIDSGQMEFTNQAVITTENSRFLLGGTNSSLIFNEGVELGENSKIEAGYGRVTVPGGDFEMGEGSLFSLSFDFLSGTGGSLDIQTNALIANSRDVKFIARGIAATPTGEVQLITSSSVVLGENTLEEIIDADFGWLVDESSEVNTNGIKTAFTYRSLTNVAVLSRIVDSNVLALVDNILIDLPSNDFHSVNSNSDENRFRYTLAEVPAVSEASFNNIRQVHEQIAVRSHQFRSMYGFASTEPAFKMPAGASGPGNGDKERTMQGWIRAYGSTASKDETGHFSAYDADSWGSVFGVDKSFGHFLIGLAGGYGRTEIDGGEAYEVDIDTYHGSIYATIGGESLFMDISAAYGRGAAEEENDLISGEFDSDLFSIYVGAGKRFDMKEKISLTPEISFLVSHYQQDGYTRKWEWESQTGTAAIKFKKYDTTSYLGTLGLNLSTLHQIDWLNQGIAFIPEVRFHWLHEFNTEADDLNLTIESIPVGVLRTRPREENTFRFGVGLNMWNWKRRNTRFELDYDTLLSESYQDHIVSGKLIQRF